MPQYPPNKSFTEASQTLGRHCGGTIVTFTYFNSETLFIRYLLIILVGYSISLI